MYEWIKKHSTSLTTVLVTIAITIFLTSCEPRVRSLDGTDKLVNRAELQLELDRYISIAALRMLDLEQQEQFRQLILQNALVLAAGQPFNPIGILTGIAGIYGVAQGTTNITKVVKTKLTKRKVKNGTT